MAKVNGAVTIWTRRIIVHESGRRQFRRAHSFANRCGSCFRPRQLALSLEHVAGDEAMAAELFSCAPPTKQNHAAKHNEGD